MERRRKSCKVRIDAGCLGRAGAGSGQHSSSMARQERWSQSAAKSGLGSVGVVFRHRDLPERQFTARFR